MEGRGEGTVMLYRLPRRAHPLRAETRCQKVRPPASSTPEPFFTGMPGPWHGPRASPAGGHARWRELRTKRSPSSPKPVSPIGIRDHANTQRHAFHGPEE